MLIFCVNIRAEKSLTYCKTLFYKMITYGAYVPTGWISFCYMVGSGNFSDTCNVCQGIKYMTGAD